MCVCGGGGGGGGPPPRGGPCIKGRAKKKTSTIRETNFLIHKKWNSVFNKHTKYIKGELKLEQNNAKMRDQEFFKYNFNKRLLVVYARAAVIKAMQQANH